MSRAEVTYVCHSRFPQRGLVVARGGFLTNAAGVVAVDFDRRRIWRITTVRDPGSQRAIVRAEDVAELGADEVDQTVRLANQLWTQGMKGSAHSPVLDAVIGVIVLDGGRVSVEDHAIDYQAGRDAADALWSLAQRKMPQSTPEAGGVPCDPG